ncbi:MFS general substrate transporter [Coniophora puteana RWD-64-598 SS2]|uniref:MFS general substrate transporter n=1 Tax=Coniophora puteana (strain RWD-64-598) TaxID=741705 RepID=A0A5M3MNH9_CONPW|nr:MFS general substrate transporter [Coniophora puteana RWD-64-598 SS2]EIW80709.1 MFS general substrate transporter [Coniophora puteana RWD-64-598 SS2]
MESPPLHANDPYGEDSPTTTLGEQDIIYVDFDQGDPRHPTSFSLTKKWTITLTACIFTILACASCSSFALGYASMIRDLGCTQFEATLGLSLYILGFAIVPLFTSAFSEEFGRRPLYLVCALFYTLAQVMTALSTNTAMMIVSRLLAGTFGSTGATVVTGTIADIWAPKDRGLPMSLYSLSAVASFGLGPLVAGWIEANPHLEWRWIQWFHAIFSGAYFLLVVVYMRETRIAIITASIARKMRKETGSDRYHSRAEDSDTAKGLKAMLWVTLTRPIFLLLTEPTVQVLSLWIGFTWGVLFCLVESISPELQAVYHFDIGETGSAYTPLVLGSIIGFFASRYQETLYQNNVARKHQEARLYLAMAAAFLLPVGMFMWAWTANPHVPWIIPLLALTIFMIGAYILYFVVFVYLADCYGMYASSAMAGQSLLRNILSTTFPLFTKQMFANLTYRWANTMFGCIACLMVPIPFLLYIYGSDLRRRSAFSRTTLETEEKQTNLAKV